MKYDYKNYILTNLERKYFGLNPIKENWERVDIKETYTIYFDGDCIRKTISFSDADNRIDYQEKDTLILTKNRQIVLPKTDKGKEKKLNYSSVSSINPSGCIFSMNLMFDFNGTKYSSNVRARNNTNSLELPINSDNNLATIEEYRSWLKKYIETCPKDYFEKVDKMKNTHHKTMKYYNGDIFRFEIDREYYGFGLIIGQLQKIKKDKIINDRHAFYSTMTVPLIVRLYKFKTKDKGLAINEITKNKLLDPFIMSDNCVIWGLYDIVGSKELTENDIEFPFHVGESLEKQNYIRLCWGIGCIVLEEYDKMPNEINNNKYLNHGVVTGINTVNFDKNISNEIEVTNRIDEVVKKVALNYFGISENISFNEFNLKYNGMTKEQYVKYANKYIRM